LIEGAQGHDLSIDSQFYPFTTSRNCWVGQALADTWAYPDDLRNVYMVIRTYPIRVAGNSGGCWPDQHETSWSDLGVKPEITTVTKKIRRVFTFSMQQVIQSVMVNRPTHLAISHMDYLPASDRETFVNRLAGELYSKVGRLPKLILGFGPDIKDWKYNDSQY
jgi:adenylosuccinate synthase